MRHSLNIIEPATLSTINVSLVAFYGGNKPPQLVALIQKLQNYLAQSVSIRHGFNPYKMEQVHGTIIGCEGFKTETGVVNTWFQQRKKANACIDFAGLIDHLHRQVDLPLTIRFGGYDRRQDYHFLSRDRHPYFRSFQLQHQTTEIVPVLIGWTWNGGISPILDELRHELQQFNLLHKYYVEPDTVDNDFYLRLGTIDPTLPFDEMKEIATKIRNLLEVSPPWDIPLNLEDLAFARYQHFTLPPETTTTMSLAETTIGKIKRLYGIDTEG